MFDTTLLESRRSPRGRGRGASLPLAIGLHVAIIGAFVGAAVWNTGDPPEPVTPVVFFPTASSLPPPPAGGPDRGRRLTTTRQRPSAAVPEVRRIPDEPTLDTAPSDPGSTALDGVIGEPGASVSDGGSGPDVTGGLGDGNGPGPGGSGHILPVAGDVKAPVLLERVEPEYPEGARRTHQEGVVILEAVITASGRVEDVRVLKSANPLLDAAAERAVRQWRYRAATLNGLPVSVSLTVTITFGLRS